MALDQEIQKARREIVSDGYDMSVGEIMNLYKDGELIINPDYQRLFRWDSSQKTRFIESLLLGIPIPPIFVFQTQEGIWELIDGLQRVSTLLEFSGDLKNSEGLPVPPSVLEGTNFLPNLANKRWEATIQDNGTSNDDGIGKSNQMEIKRARLRVEILKKESDVIAKYELFQRLNTGGSNLSPQEVRNCVAIMLDRNFYNWLKICANNEDFLKTIDQTPDALEKQAGMELALRFFAFRNIPYDKTLDVHEYLDSSLIKMATDTTFDKEAEAQIFRKTFHLLNEALGDNAFKKWTGSRFSGMFLQSLFEIVATGISKNITELEGLPPVVRNTFLNEKVKAVWENETFQKNSGAGVRGTTRLSNLLPMAQAFFTHG